MNENERNDVIELIKRGDDILELAQHGDYSNGVTAEGGIDEGRIVGYEILKSREASWDSIKAHIQKVYELPDAANVAAQGAEVAEICRPCFVIPVNKNLCPNIAFCAAREPLDCECYGCEGLYCAACLYWDKFE